MTACEPVDLGCRFARCMTEWSFAAFASVAHMAMTATRTKCEFAAIAQEAALVRIFGLLAVILTTLAAAVMSIQN